MSMAEEDGSEKGAGKVATTRELNIIRLERVGKSTGAPRG